MKIKFLRIALIVGITASTCMPVQAKAQQPPKNDELNTILMQSTFKLEGQNSVGTAFIVGRPYPDQTGKARYVLVTAAHVLEQMQGETATLDLRRMEGSDNWVRVPYPIPIRSNGSPLWKKHPDADVAVMYVRIPTTVTIRFLSTSLLADDKSLSDLKIHPGDELECLGYPLAQEANEAGFPILRSGKIASYPLLPTKKTKTFLFDFRVFKGNSGGPVYMAQSTRSMGGGEILAGDFYYIVGLVSQEALFPEHVLTPYSEELRQVQLGLAVVVHASMIKEAIDSLPSPETLPD